jgi:hypothetical protein
VPTASAEYTRRLEASERTIAQKQKLHIRAGNAKLIAIVAGLVMAWLAIYPRTLSLLWLLVPAAVYSALAIFHYEVNRARSRAERVAAFHRRGLARLEDRWAGGGATGERFGNVHSIYADDLDLFGSGSLFELLSTARTTMGEAWLARWLLEPSGVLGIRERQALVAELQDKLDLREELAVTGEQLRATLDDQALVHWAQSKAAGWRPGLRWVFAALAAATVASAVAIAIARIGLPFLIAITLEGGFTLWLWKTAKAALGDVDLDDQSLLLLAALLKRIEELSIASPRLQKLAAELKSQDACASRAIRKLARLANWMNARDSLAVRIFGFPLMYTMQLGFAVEGWKRRYGHRLNSWLGVIGEWEALLSLANYAYEHPQDPFPTLIEAEEPLFAGDELGHPLLPSATCVPNSIRLAMGATQALIVSGSNMSGKSTLLRTVGVNAVLAMTGAPVRAKSLTLTPLALGTSIRTTDSLREGRSGFYTEILRLREVFKLAEVGTPVLFLFDELLAGTNSTDRKIGAEGLIRELMGRRAIGMVTTHDMALTAISPASTHAGSVANAHFQESIDGGRMTFDYKLRDGPVEKGNALELMRLIGLKV